jgi:hypothetical protein
LFDAKTRVTRENVLQMVEGEELLGIRFLRWMTEYYSHPVVVLSGFLYKAVTDKLRSDYPHVLLKAKPVDLNAREFRTNMEYYAKTFYRTKREMSEGRKEPTTT